MPRMPMLEAYVSERLGVVCIGKGDGGGGKRRVSCATDSDYVIVFTV
jgi:hypothetical protein